MVGVLVVVAVWSLCLVAILRLRYEVTRTRLPSPDKWEPVEWPESMPYPLFRSDGSVEWIDLGRPKVRRGGIHVEVLPGHESEAAEEVLRADLDLAREGL